MELNGKIIAYCGLVCSECGAYIATQAGDQAALARVAAQWEEEYGVDHVTIQDVTCDGCLGLDGRKGSHCSQCEIRACGLGRGVVNCAHCSDYACGKLEEFFGLVPDARVLLDQIRAAL